VKNLPVRPLAPRRKTPGQLNPTSKDLPGWVMEFQLITFEKRRDIDSLEKY